MLGCGPLRWVWTYRAPPAVFGAGERSNRAICMYQCVRRPVNAPESDRGPERAGRQSSPVSVVPSCPRARPLRHVLNLSTRRGRARARDRKNRIFNVGPSGRSSRPRRLISLCVGCPAAPCQCDGRRRRSHPLYTNHRPAPSHATSDYAFDSLAGSEQPSTPRPFSPDTASKFAVTLQFQSVEVARVAH